MIGRKLIRAEIPLESSQLQPASLDLRLSKEAYRVRASFLPGRERTVRERLESLNAEPVSLAGNGAVLEKGIVYIARLMERLELQAEPFRAPQTRRARPGGSTFSPASSSTAPRRSTTCRSATGASFGWRFRRAASASASSGARSSTRSGFAAAIPSRWDRHKFTLDDAEIRKRASRAEPARRSVPSTLREGVVLRVDLGGSARDVVGYRAIKNSDVIDVNRAARLRGRGFLGADSRSRRSAADPRSRRVLHPRIAREGADPRRPRRRNGADRSGDRRVPRPLRRLLRSGFRAGRGRAPAARAVLEVRCARRAVPARGRPAGRAAGV